MPPRKKKSAKETRAETTARLMAELGGGTPKEKPAPPPKKKSYPRKPDPETKETRALLAERKRVYKLICAAWKDPAKKGLRTDEVAGYFRGLMAYERQVNRPTDYVLLGELRFLVQFWTNIHGD